MLDGVMYMYLEEIEELRSLPFAVPHQGKPLEELKLCAFARNPGTDTSVAFRPTEI